MADIAVEELVILANVQVRQTLSSSKQTIIALRNAGLSNDQIAEMFGPTLCKRAATIVSSLIGAGASRSLAVATGDAYFDAIVAGISSTVQ
jgi:hypothetical protein